MKKIALEEHFVTPDFLKLTQTADFPFMDPKCTSNFQECLLDFDNQRIAAMDRAGIEIAVLSLTDPGAQGQLDKGTAIKLTQQTNDFLAHRISRNPKRFRGFATLPLQDPIAATKELERCIRDYKFLGALINGQTGGLYLDDSRYLPFWEKVQELNVPIYLHPGSPATMSDSYNGHPELSGALWGWTAETATHTLRLIFSGLFDRCPGLTLILGHMGETLPFLLWRLDSRWAILKQPRKLKKSPSQYIKDHVYVTTSGMCSNGPLLCALQELGENRIMFATDYPYESIDIATKFIEQAPLSEEVRQHICYRNAQRLFPLAAEAHAAIAK